MRNAMIFDILFLKRTIHIDRGTLSDFNLTHKSSSFDFHRVEGINDKDDNERK